MKEKLVSVIEHFKKIKVLVIGDGILDTYIKGTTDRICREAPVPVINVQSEEHQSGGAANTAINLSALGAEVYFLTVLGKDATARILIEELKQHKVHTEYILQDKTRVTLAKKRITAAANILLRMDQGTTASISNACEKALIERVEKLYKEVDVIILSDYGYGIITDALISFFKEIPISARKPVVVDAKDLYRFKLIKPTAVKPNYEEAVKLLKIEKLSNGSRAQEILTHQKKIMELTGAAKVAVTLDADGVLFFEKGKSPYRILCIPREDSKAVGAGDTFVGALALSLASNAKGQTAAEIAAAAAAIVVQKEGTARCTNEELKAHVSAVPKYITSVDILVNMVTELRRKGKRIVFTNGCFDILHQGHIALLNKAKQQGDILIVGVNNDASIRKVKGRDRPINTLEDRITVLAGLQSVDYVIAFEEESPVHLIEATRPDVFVKGGNYTESSIPEAKVVKKAGGIIHIVPYEKEHSTTEIINKIKLQSDVPQTKTKDKRIAPTHRITL